MKFLHTGHPISDTVMQAAMAGWPGLEPARWQQIVENPEPCIGYGILRGNKEAFFACEAAGVPWWQIDHGYFGRSEHPQLGTLRVSRRGTQAAFSPPSDVGIRKFVESGLEKRPMRYVDGYILLVPPTRPVAEFFGVENWSMDVQEWLQKLNVDFPCKIRTKDSEQNIDDDIAGAYAAVGFNSSILWKALLSGVPAIGSVYSIVHSWNQLNLIDLHDFGSLMKHKRSELFGCMFENQLTLDEIKKGELCKLINR